MKKRQSRFTRVIIESPYAGDVAGNHKYLQRAIRDCVSRGETPYASHQILTDALDDCEPVERALGMRAGRDWYEAASMCVVYDDYGISGEMRIGIAHAEEIGLYVEHRQIGKNDETHSTPPLPIRLRPGRRREPNGATRARIVELRTLGHTQRSIAQIVGCTVWNVARHLKEDARRSEVDPTADLL